MIKNISVADIMTRDPETISPDVSLFECANKIVKKRVSGLLLVEEKKLAGFITYRDILWALIKGSDLKKVKVKEIAAKKLITVKPNTFLDEALSKIKKSKFRRLPVVDNGELVGIITIKDILTFTPEIYPELNEIEKIKEEQEKLNRIKQAKNREYMHEGICEECGSTDILYKIDGRLLCEFCKEGM